ncbi:Peptidase family S41 [compost metagenome]
MYGSLLYRYLALSPFRYYKGLYSATKNLPYNDFRKANSSFNDLRPDMLIPEGKRYRLSDAAHDNLREQTPLIPGFEGKLIVLINGGTFSAAAEFCAIAKANKRAIFVGEETGGAARTNTSAVARSFTLLNSGLQISFGLIRYELPVQRLPKYRGTLPDLPVAIKFQDLINGIDRQMDAALQLSNDR